MAEEGPDVIVECDVCGYLPCITRSEEFQKVLTTTIGKTPKQKRFRAYWKIDFLLNGNQEPPLGVKITKPQCVVDIVHQTWPD